MSLSESSYLAIRLLLTLRKLSQPFVVVPTKRSFFPSVIKPHFDLVATLENTINRDIYSTDQLTLNGSGVKQCESTIAGLSMGQKAQRKTFVHLRGQRQQNGSR